MGVSGFYKATSEHQEPIDLAELAGKDVAVDLLYFMMKGKTNKHQPACFYIFALLK